MEQINGQEIVEINRAIVTDWIKNISERREVHPIPADLLRSVLEGYGANFEISEEARESLKGYSENDKAKGVRAVWGDDRYVDFKDWVKEYIEEHENSTGKELPALKPSGRKNSGMIQFLGELTSFAAGEMEFDTFKLYIESRVRNGAAWAEDRKGDRVRVRVPTSDEPILLSSIPPEFPAAAWKKIQAGPVVNSQ